MSDALGSVPRGTPGARQNGDARSQGQRSPVLDRVIGQLAGAARAAAVLRINRSGGRIIEIGTASGQTLAKVGSNVELVGVDQHFARLRIAAARRDRLGGSNVAGLVGAGYTALPFADGAFDAALACFVLTGLTEPAAAFAEIDRVVRPGGEIVVVDYFAHETGWLAWIEKLVGLFGGAGSRIDPIIDRPGLSLTASHRLPPFGLFSIVAFRKDDAGAIAAWRMSAIKRPIASANSGQRRRRRNSMAPAMKPRR